MEVKNQLVIPCREDDNPQDMAEDIFGSMIWHRIGAGEHKGCLAAYPYDTEHPVMIKPLVA